MIQTTRELIQDQYASRICWFAFHASTSYVEFAHTCQMVVSHYVTLTTPQPTWVQGATGE